MKNFLSLSSCLVETAKDFHILLNMDFRFSGSRLNRISRYFMSASYVKSANCQIIVSVNKTFFREILTVK